jgi:hypothetical protein
MIARACLVVTIAPAGEARRVERTLTVEEVSSFRDGGGGCGGMGCSVR